MAALPSPDLRTGVALRAEGLTKRYGDLIAVDGLTLEVRHGEILGFLGPNGAGKTTSIGMMCGLIRPDSGEAFIDGHSVRHARRIRQARGRGGESVRGQVGLAPQEVVIWPKLTCLEQLEFMGAMYGLPGGLARRRGRELLTTLGLDDRRDTVARTLSGGMQRRLNLALALVHDPAILFLDEPEAGLDPQGRVLAREFIRSLARSGGKAVVLTTHNMDEADRLVDRVAVIDRGRLLTLDTPENLKRRIDAVRFREITLEDVFLALTGRSLRE